jgi:hypothetical protein
MNKWNQDKNKEQLTWSPNNFYCHLGLFGALCITGVGPNNSVSCEIRKNIYLFIVVSCNDQCLAPSVAGDLNNRWYPWHHQNGYSMSQVQHFSNSCTCQTCGAFTVGLPIPVLTLMVIDEFDRWLGGDLLLGLPPCNIYYRVSRV